MCLRQALVVEAAGVEEMGDGLVDRVGGVLTRQQAVAAFGDRQRAPGEEMERVEVGGAPGVSRQTG